MSPLTSNRGLTLPFYSTKSVIFVSITSEDKISNE